MILIGQYDSPFVRRVGVALRLYDLAFEHRPWSTFGDAEAIAAFNPLRRVPTLVLDDGEVVVDSPTILDHLDELAAPGRRLVPISGPERRRILKVCALAMGMADKVVSLFYERALHPEISPVWVARCEAQITGCLDVLEQDRALRTTSFWFGEVLTHADIAVTCALGSLRAAHPGIFDPARWPALDRHGARCEEREPFIEISQPFIPPA